MLCTGDRQYYSLIFRCGYSDVLLRHPNLAEMKWSAYYTTLGGGAASVPVELMPGKVFNIEFSYRKHYEYWQKPSYENSGTPLPELPKHPAA
jgi:hypothetical protein